VQVAVKVPVVQQVPVEVSRPYPVLVQQQQPVLWQKVSTPQPYPVYVTEQRPVQWQKQPNYYSTVDNGKNYIGMTVYNGGNQPGYQHGQYPSGYSIGVNHALIGLGVGGRGSGATGSAQGAPGATGVISGTAGSLLGTAFNVMQGLMSPGGSITGYATGHNDYLGPKTTGFSTVINK